MPVDGPNAWVLISYLEDKPERSGSRPRHIMLSILQPQEEHDLATH